MALYEIAPGTVTQIVWAPVSLPSQQYGVQQALIFNRDNVNPIYIWCNRNDPTDVPSALTVDNNLSSLVTALEQKTVVATLNWWAIAPASNTGNVQVEVTFGGLNAVISPAESAAQLAISGVPLLHGFDQVAAGTASVAANSSVFLPNMTFTRPGYIVAFNPVYTSASGTTPFSAVQWRWLNTAGTIDLGGNNSWVMKTLASAGYGPTLGKGPVIGPVAQVAFNNYDTAQAISVQYAIWESTHHIARDDLRDSSASWSAPPGFTAAPGGNLSALKMFQGSPTIPATTTNKYIMPLFAGPVGLYATLASSTAGVIEFAITGALTSDPIFAAVATGGAGGTQLIVNPILLTLPREPCQVIISNASTASLITAIGITAQEFVS